VEEGAITRTIKCRTPGWPFVVIHVNGVPHDYAPTGWVIKKKKLLVMLGFDRFVKG
jgi:hypothetical protein